MTRPPVLVRCDHPVLLVGAGPLPPGMPGSVLDLAPALVAVDGGAHHVETHHDRILAVLGDMDSVDPDWSARHPAIPVHRITEQDSTDLEKGLYSTEAPLLLGLGFLGGRMDHHLAAMNALVKNPQRRLILIGDEDICFLCPPRLNLDLPAGTRVSFFPMSQARGLASTGLRWPVDGLDFRPDGRIGTSNEATGGRMQAGFDRPGILVILPQDSLRQVAARLEAGEAWPGNAGAS